MKFPLKKAYNLAQRLKKFRTLLTIVSYCEENGSAVQHRDDVLKNVNWDNYEELIKELEYAYKISYNIK